MSFSTHFQQLDWDDSRLSIYGKRARDVERALSSPKRTLDDFKALISPAAEPYLETMAQMLIRSLANVLAIPCRCTFRSISLIFARIPVPIAAFQWITESSVKH